MREIINMTTIKLSNGVEVEGCDLKEANKLARKEQAKIDRLERAEGVKRDWARKAALESIGHIVQMLDHSHRGGFWYSAHKIQQRAGEWGSERLITVCYVGYGDDQGLATIKLSGYEAYEMLCCANGHIEAIKIRSLRESADRDEHWLMVGCYQGVAVLEECPKVIAEAFERCLEALRKQDTA